MKINRFLNYICKKYEETDLEMDAIAGNKNIKRHTRLTMSSYVENSIAILIEDILSKQGKKYNYLVDVQLNVDVELEYLDSNEMLVKYPQGGGKSNSWSSLRSI